MLLCYVHMNPAVLGVQGRAAEHPCARTSGAFPRPPHSARTSSRCPSGVCVEECCIDPRVRHVAIPSSVWGGVAQRTDSPALAHPSRLLIACETAPGPKVQLRPTAADNGRTSRHAGDDCAPGGSHRNLGSGERLPGVASDRDSRLKMKLTRPLLAVHRGIAHQLRAHR